MTSALPTVAVRPEHVASVGLSQQAGPVVTVTPNPSLDHTVEVEVLVRGRFSAPDTLWSRPAERVSTSHARWPGTGTGPPRSCPPATTPSG